LGLSVPGNPDRFLVGLAVLSLLSEFAEDSPVVCLIDDAHWLDAASADALLFTARRLDAEGVVMLLASRDGARPFAAAGLRDLAVTPLTADQAGRVLDERAPLLAPGLREQVLAEAEGHPLGLVELAGALPGDAGGAGTAPLPVAKRVQEVLAAQVRQLGDPAGLMLLLAAAEPTGDLALVLQAAAEFGTGADALAVAERAGLVAVGRGGGGFLPPPGGGAGRLRGHPALRPSARAARGG